MLKYADLDVLEYENPAAYALRALVEQSFISKDCDKSLIFINKAIELDNNFLFNKSKKD